MNEQAMRSDNKPMYFGRDLEAMSFAINYHKWIISEFKPYLGDCVAEVGAGTGSFSKLLIATHTKHLVAFEPSANMFPLLQDRLREESHIKTVNHFFGEVYHRYETGFDSVIYVNVLEHIEDDKKELSYVYEGLRESGHLLIFVPALSWLYGAVDKEVGHYRRYHKGDLIRLTEGAGFNIVKVKYFDMAGIIPWYVAFVLLKKSMTGSTVSLYDKWVVPVMRRVEGVITPPVGKNLLLVAKKV